MFKVDRDAIGRYKISIGVGKTFQAGTLEEVAYGLQHYFQQSLFENRWDYQKHIEHNKVCHCCPLCDKVA